MKLNIFTRPAKALALLLALSIFNPAESLLPVEQTACAASRSKKSSPKRGSSRKSGARKSGTRKNKSAKKRSGGHHIQTLWRSEDSSQWIRKGAKGIIISKDSTGTVRAMTPYTCPPSVGAKYAEALNAYADALEGGSVTIYSVIVPTQGEYYMPELTSTKGAEQRAIDATARSLKKGIRPVFVGDSLRKHLDEDIYNRTDHHWSPLGAYYASAALADAAGVKCRPLSQYTTDTVRNYVGTMYKFSGDPEVKKAPEEFIYYIPPKGYKAEFINYRISGGRTIGEGEPHYEEFFRKFPDGSGAAYSTFMGGDSRTVKVTGTGGTPGRRLLIVKDSYGNAMASCLFGSFEEVHVIDFRFFPHNLVDYVKKNGITDLAFVNCISLGYSANAASRFRTMLTAGHSAKANEETTAEENGENEETEEESDEE